MANAAVASHTRDAPERPASREPVTAVAAAPDYAEMMARYLGPAATRAVADDDVAEVSVNPQDSRVRVDTRSRGRVGTGHGLDAARVATFLNAAAAPLGTALGADRPRLEAELPAETFRGSRLQRRSASKRVGARGPPGATEASPSRLP